MSHLTKARVIPVLSLLAGLAVTGLVGTARHQSQADAEAEIQERFQELDPQQQNAIQERADAFSERWAADPDERDRLREIQSALAEDPELSEKLNRLYDWWQTLEPSQRSQVRNSGDWVKETQQLYFDTQLIRNSFVVRTFRAGKLTTFRLTEAAYQRFLDELVAGSADPELQKAIASLNGSDQACERTLIKSLWLLRQFFPFRGAGGDGERPRPTLNPEQVRRALADHVIVDSAKQREFDLVRDSSTEAFFNLNDSRNILWIAFAVVRSGIAHYDDPFKQKYLGDQRASVAALFDELDRKQRLEMMKMEPSEAESLLEGMLIERLNPENPAISGIAEQLQLLEDPRRMQFGFSRGGRSRGPGPRPSDGRGGPGRGGPGGEGRGERKAGDGLGRPPQRPRPDER